MVVHNPVTFQSSHMTTIIYVDDVMIDDIVAKVEEKMNAKNILKERFSVVNVSERDFSGDYDISALLKENCEMIAIECRDCGINIDEFFEDLCFAWGSICL